MPVTLFRNMPKEDEVPPGAEEWWEETIARRRRAFAHAHLTWQWRSIDVTDVPDGVSPAWVAHLQKIGRL